VLIMEDDFLLCPKAIHLLHHAMAQVEHRDALWNGTCRRA